MTDPFQGLLAEEFSRNLGWISPEEQKRLFDTRVAVAGAGGVGGGHILTLARLGVGRFSIADPDRFEKANMNRQLGANIHTLGKNKAEVLAQMVKDINPYADVRVFPEGVKPETLEAFLEGVDIYADGIDFYAIDVRRSVFQRAREKGIYAITAGPIGFGATLQIFSPHGMSFDDYFGITDKMSYVEKMSCFVVGIAPNPYHLTYVDLSKVVVAEKKGHAVSLACTLASSLVTMSVVKIVTGRGDLKCVPHFLQIDLFRGKFKQAVIWGGARNPIQKLKKALFMKKAIGWGLKE